MSNQMTCLSCQQPDNSLLIVETEHWKAILAEDQAYLGRSYVTLKRHGESLSDLSQTEWDDLKTVITQLEATMKKAFGATMFNWTCLMNLAYQNDPPNPHVHWHFRPRYDKSINFAGQTFADPEFGHHYSSERKAIMTPQILTQVAAIIKAQGI